jgi:hypothetical protein
MTAARLEILLSLRRIERRWRALNLVIDLLRAAVAITLLILAGTMMLGMLDDSFVRLCAIISLSIWAAILFALGFLLHDTFRRRPLTWLARQIERQRLDLEERLSSAIELSQAGSFAASPALVEQLVLQAELDAAKLPARALVPTRLAMPWLAWLVATLITSGILAAFPVTGRVLATGLGRLVVPWRQAPAVVQSEATRAHAAPEILNLFVRYEYPRYTGLVPRTITGLDGTVDAVIGSRATILVETLRPLDANRSSLTPAGSPRIRLEATSAARKAYAAGITVRVDSSYTIELVDAATGEWRYESPRAIHARPDQLPSIVIESPAPKVSVRPDDTVPVQFLAADDFGVARIEMNVSVDDRKPRVFTVSFDVAVRKHVIGPMFNLAVGDVLQGMQLTEAHEITYQLRVADNREPDPQLSASARQTLRVRPDQARSFLGEQEQQTAMQLQDTLEAAVREMDRTAGGIGRARTRYGSEPLGEWQHKELHQAAADVAGISKGLGRAADQAADSVFAKVATQIKQVADGPLREAAEAAARADVESDDWKHPNDAIDKSITAIRAARESLRKLLGGKDIDRLRGMSESARDLASAAKLQRAGNNELAKIRLGQAFQESPSLREQNVLDTTMREAAQAAQAAEHSQQIGASQQAVGELQLAASAMGRALSMASRPDPNDAGAPAPQALADGSSNASHGSGLGGPVPAAVRDLGLSADDWARLPPLAQRDLLNTAQQSPPPAYRQLVRDYFVRLARMHDSTDVRP